MMNITKAKYQLNPIDSDDKSTIEATIDGQEYSVPVNSENRHYIEIKRQVDAGELTIEDAD